MFGRYLNAIFNARRNFLINDRTFGLLEPQRLKNTGERTSGTLPTIVNVDGAEEIVMTSEYQSISFFHVTHEDFQESTWSWDHPPDGF